MLSYNDNFVDKIHLCIFVQDKLLIYAAKYRATFINTIRVKYAFI